MTSKADPKVVARLTWLQVRMATTELAQLAQGAAAAGDTMSAYVRRTMARQARRDIARAATVTPIAVDRKATL